MELMAQRGEHRKNIGSTRVSRPDPPGCYPAFATWKAPVHRAHVWLKGGCDECDEAQVAVLLHQAFLDIFQLKASHIPTPSSMQWCLMRHRSVTTKPLRWLPNLRNPSPFLKHILEIVKLMWRICWRMHTAVQHSIYGKEGSGLIYNWL